MIQILCLFTVVFGLPLVVFHRIRTEVRDYPDQEPQIFLGHIVLMIIVLAVSILTVHSMNDA